MKRIVVSSSDRCFDIVKGSDCQILMMIFDDDFC